MTEADIYQLLAIGDDFYIIESHKATEYVANTKQVYYVQIKDDFTYIKCLFIYNGKWRHKENPSCVKVNIDKLWQYSSSDITIELLDIDKFLEEHFAELL